MSDHERVAFRGAQLFGERGDVFCRQAGGNDSESLSQRRGGFLGPFELGRINRSDPSVAQDSRQSFSSGTPCFGQIGVFRGISFFGMTNDENGRLRIGGANEGGEQQTAESRAFHIDEFISNSDLCATNGVSEIGAGLRKSVERTSIGNAKKEANCPVACELFAGILPQRQMSTAAEQRLKDLGIALPTPPEPFGTYVEAVQTGNLLFLTGMLPTEGRAAKFVGRLGAELDVEEGRKAARLAALNALAVAREHLGSLDKVTRVVRLGVFVATSGDVRDQPKVADGASELLQDVFGKEKNPCRSVFGVASLPLGAPVELEIIFEVEG